jgi:membrane-associated phospholipid phosphatase
MPTLAPRASSFALPLAAAFAAALSIWPLRQWVDGPALALAYAYDGSFWTVPAELLTELGQWVAWVAAAACVTLAAGRLGARRLARDAGQLVLALLVAGAIGIALKIAFGEPEPDLALSLGSHAFTWFRLANAWHAFPSGHALTAGTVVATAWLLGLRGRGAIVAAGVFIAATRFIIAVHFVSDVVAGFALGAVCAYLVHEAVRRWTFARATAA